MNDFDFDDWADLHRRDPAAFEARRQAALALELAKAEPGLAIPARQMLRGLDERMAGLEGHARLDAAAAQLAASVGMLSERMVELLDATRSAMRQLRR